MKSGGLKCSRSPGAASSVKSCVDVPYCCAQNHGVLWGQATLLHSSGRGEHPSIRAGGPCVLVGLSCSMWSCCAFGSPFWKEGGKEGG